MREEDVRAKIITLGQVNGVKPNFTFTTKKTQYSSGLVARIIIFWGPIH